MLKLIDYFDTDTGQNYAIIYDGELSHDERRQAVLAFTPCGIIPHPKGDIFVVAVDSTWTPPKL